MSRVGGRFVKCHLGMGRHLDPAWAAGVIREGEAPDLHRCIRRNRDLDTGIDPINLPTDLEDSRSPAGHMSTTGTEHGLKTRRPDGATLEISQIDEKPVRVLDAIAPPAGERVSIG
jgi:hypothetical protein